MSREIITGCLAFTGALAPQIGRLDGEVRALAKADPRVRILTTLPGIGQFTALVMLAGIGDTTRFANARKLASWAGLTPTVPRLGPDRPARAHPRTGLGAAALGPGQAAQTAKRFPEFAATYAAIARRRGKKIATIAIARNC